jgi:MFS family permease
MSSSHTGGVTPRILSVVIFNFVGYLTIGLPLAVLPPYLISKGYGPFLAGVAISLQYVATFLSRAPAGRLADAKGPKQAVLLGLAACGVSGLCLVSASWFESIPALSLTLLFASRLVLGVGESFVTMSAILWSIGLVGPKHTARVISWNGITTYTALAMGAPLGIFIQKGFGFAAIGWVIFLLGAVCFPLAWRKPGTAIVPGKPIPIHRVFGRVLPFGLGLALGSLGFGSIATFITLFFSERGWEHAALCLTAFGIFFVSIRLIFASAIDRFGGYRVSMLCFSVECVGLLLLWKASSMGMALVGASLTGIGFSLVFPALAVEAVARVSADNRGAALAMYSLFVDIALGSTGPLGGWVASQYGFPAVYLCAAAAAFSGLALAWGIYLSIRRERLILSTRPQN